MKKENVCWLKKPQKHDYPAAESYLSLIIEPQTAKIAAKKFVVAETTLLPAKDIFRASGVSLLGVSNSHVQEVRTQIINGESLSPLLLCRDRDHGKLIIADGYHRLCAVYTFDEDAMIPCRIV